MDALVLLGSLALLLTIGVPVADTASIGSVLIPEMEKKGYPRDFATAVTCATSVQALLIPPSHNAVIYSLAAGGTVSIGALFLAGSSRVSCWAAPWRRSVSTLPTSATIRKARRFRSGRP